MSRILLFTLLALLFFGTGCATNRVQNYYTDTEYKTESHPEYALAPLLFQYKFVNPVQEHEILILDNQRQKFTVRIRDPKVSAEGFIVNLPAGRSYAVASFYIINGLTKKELQVAKSLPTFVLSKNRLTRIRGFDVINDSDPDSDTVSIAPWDGMTDNLLTVQATRKFQIDEKSIQTVDIFRKP